MMFPFASRKTVLQTVKSPSSDLPFCFCVTGVDVRTVRAVARPVSLFNYTDDASYVAMDREVYDQQERLREKRPHWSWTDNPLCSVPRIATPSKVPGTSLYTDPLSAGRDAQKHGTLPPTSEPCVVYVQGVDMHGRTVLATVNDFRPYLVCRCPEFVSVEAMREFAQFLSTTLGRQVGVSGGDVRVRCVALKKFRFWWSNARNPGERGKFPHFVIYFPNTEYLEAGRRALSRGIPLGGRWKQHGREVTLSCEEAAVEPHTKWYSALGVKRMGWCVVQAKAYTVSSPAASRVSYADIELSTTCDALKGLTDEMYTELKEAYSTLGISGTHTRDHGNVLPKPDDVPPLLWRSSDIETCNPQCDGPPNALVQNNCVTMISDVYMWSGHVPVALRRESCANAITRQLHMYVDEKIQEADQDLEKARLRKQVRLKDRRAKRRHRRALLQKQRSVGTAGVPRAEQEEMEDVEFASSGSEVEAEEESSCVQKRSKMEKEWTYVKQYGTMCYMWPQGSLYAKMSGSDVDFTCMDDRDGESCSFMGSLRVDAVGVMPDRPFLKVLFVLGECDPIPGVCVLTFRTERELLNGWRDVGRYMCPDITTGWNWDKYDQPYLYRRAAILNASRFFRQGMLCSDWTRAFLVRVASNALGDNITLRLSRGYGSFDMFPFVRSNYSFPNYKLDTVARHLLGSRKVGVSYGQVNRAGTGASPSEMADIGYYCVVDSELVLRIMQRTSAASTVIQFCRIMAVELDEFSKRGQQIRVRNQVLDDCRAHGFVLDGLNRKRAVTLPCGTKQKGEEEEKYGCSPEDASYEGGFVVDSDLGFVTDPIVTLDFSSLYPSIQQRYNICPSTFIPPCVPQSVVESWEEKGLRVEYVDGTLGRHRFVQNEKGVMPMRLKLMYEARKATKRQMADAERQGNYELATALDAKQKAQKSTMNSFYGALAAAGGMLTMKEISDAITAKGRQLTKSAIEFVRKEYGHLGWFVRAGDTDSIMVQMPVSQQARSEGQDAILAEAWARGEILVKRFNTEIFQDPIKYELEKVFIRSMFVARKKYATFQVEDDLHNKPKLKARGLTCERRDNPAFVRRAQKRTMHFLLQEGNTRAALACARKFARALVQRRFDLEDLVIYKEIKGGKGWGPPPAAHVACAFRMGHLQKGGMPASGERIGYLVSTISDSRNGIPPVDADGMTSAASVKQSAITSRTLSSCVKPGFRLADCGVRAATAQAKLDKDRIYTRVRTMEEVASNPELHPLDLEYYLLNQLCNPLLDVLPDSEKVAFRGYVSRLVSQLQGIKSMDVDVVGAESTAWRQGVCVHQRHAKSLHLKDTDQDRKRRADDQMAPTDVSSFRLVKPVSKKSRKYQMQSLTASKMCSGF